MARRWWTLAVALPLAWGCASGAPTKGNPAHPDTKATAPAFKDPTEFARFLYAMGETALARGDTLLAIAEWQEAVRQLPQTSDYDQIRHALILRIGQGLQLAHVQTKDRAFLDAGQQMLTQYRDKHEELFGEPEGPRLIRERYELLSMLADFDEALAGHEMPRPAQMDELVADARVQLALDPAAYVPPAVRRAVLDEVPDDHAGETLDGEVRRDVKVRRRKLASLDDPRVWRFLHAPQPEGRSLLAMGPTELVSHGPRVLVRAGLPRLGQVSGEARTDARKQAWAILRAGRPGLERCFEETLTRRPLDMARVRVSYRVASDGSVTDVRVRGDSIGDAMGDACVYRTFASQQAPERSSEGAATVDMPVVFFLEGSKVIESRPMAPTMSPGPVGSAVASHASERQCAGCTSGVGPPVNQPDFRIPE